MILVRDVFRMKFGKARDVVALWKEGLEVNKKAGYSKKTSRLLTDLVGPYYTLVLETVFESLEEFERMGRSVSKSPEWREWYARVSPLLEGGYREIFNIVE